MATDKLVDFDHVTDYISRQAAINIVCHDDCEDCPDGGCDMYRRMKRLPTADVRPAVKARWYWDNYKYDWCCSNCFHPADHSIDKDDTYKEPSFKFCPHCGAMTGDNLDTTKGERRDELSG